MPEVEGPLAAGASALPSDLTLAELFGRRVAVLRSALRSDAAAVRRLAARLLPPPGPHPLPARLAAAAVRLLGGEDAYILAPYGPAGRVRRVSYHRVMDGKPEALQDLEGRIVFIGASEVEDGDRAGCDTFRTALSGSIDHSGVEIAATACLNLLHGDAVLTPAWPAMALFAGGAAAAVIAAFAALPPLAALASLPLAGASRPPGLPTLPWRCCGWHFRSRRRSWCRCPSASSAASCSSTPPCSGQRSGSPPAPPASRSATVPARSLEIATDCVVRPRQGLGWGRT